MEPKDSLPDAAEGEPERTETCPLCGGIIVIVHIPHAGRAIEAGHVYGCLREKDNDEWDINIILLIGS